MPTLRLKSAIAFAFVAVASVDAASDPPSGELAAAVSKVHSAAARRDYLALRASMAKEFTWGFGGDADIEQALTEWQKDARYLSGLAKVTQAKCGWIEGGIYQCPAKPGLKFRAGFKQVGGIWKMVYFVEGD